jgi:hypothetical protein
MVNIDRLGNVYYIRACRTHLGLIREDVNVVWDLAAHDTSIFIYLLGRFVVLSGFKHEQY